MISSEMVATLNAAKSLLTLASEDKESGNFFGASCLVREYEEIVESELNYWRVDWAYAYTLGLVWDVLPFY